MKLQDIISEETVEDYTDRLVRSLNIKQLGAGHYSSVFQHPMYHNVVVKLCRKQDPMTIRYLKLGQKFPDNPWFPKIVGIHAVRFHGLDKYESNKLRYVTHIVFMQKLRPVTPKQYAKAAQQLFKTLPDKFFAVPVPRTISGVRMTPEQKLKRAEALKINDEPQRIFPELQDIDTIEDMRVDEWKIFARYSSDERIRQLAKVLVAVGADDIHWDNLMKRDDGTFVITDPVAS